MPKLISTKQKKKLRKLVITDESIGEDVIQDPPVTTSQDTSNVEMTIISSQLSQPEPFIVSLAMVSNVKLPSLKEHQSIMDKMWIWMTIPLPEEDQVVPHSPEPEDDHAPEVPLPTSPLSKDEKPHKDEEDEEIDNSSMYPESSSKDDSTDHVDYFKPYTEEETNAIDGGKPDPAPPSLEVPPLPYHRSFRLHITIIEWHEEDIIRFHNEVGLSSRAPICDPILETSIETTIYVLVTRTAEHSDRIHYIDVELRVLNSEIGHLLGRVLEFEKRKDINEIRILHAYNHLEEARSQNMIQLIMMDEMELCTEILEETIAVIEARELN
ncbi:unnamed protein product [Lactuca saligna]|uniref:Uncharacterized protein n=1 Tax=Lactuca saligna TaxID=75948 RepID=A0AA36EAA7_LACSI|nr:unnamed protein product [Lactuca saligna]